MNRSFLVAAAVLCVLPATPASAAEIFGGLYVHDVDTVLTKSGIESGADVVVGWRGDRIGATPLQPHVFGGLNTDGNTSYAAAGISARFGTRVYLRPGLGIAIHNGFTGDFERPEGDRIAFGSRVLFEPEIAVGVQLNPRTSIEASWVHLSHAQLLSSQNPGLDNFGVRLNVGL